jgi:hypothetical protein
MPQATLQRIPDGATGTPNSKFRLKVPRWFITGGTAPQPENNLAAPLSANSPLISASSFSVAGAGVASITTPAQFANGPITSVTNQWTRDGTNIAAATGATYAFVAADVGHVVALVQTGTNATGTGTSTSNSLGPIVA